MTTKKQTKRSSSPKARSLKAMMRDQRGLTTVEYIIILCLIAVVGFAVWTTFGATIRDKVGGATTVVEGLPTSS